MVKERKLVILPHQIGVSFRLAAIPSPDTWKTPEKPLKKEEFHQENLASCYIWPKNLKTLPRTTELQPTWVGINGKYQAKELPNIFYQATKSFALFTWQRIQILWSPMALALFQCGASGDLFGLPKFAEPRTKLTDIEFDAAILGEFGSCLKHWG